MKRKTPAKRKQKRAVNKKPAFLAAFKVSASLTEAAAATGIDRGQHYDWLRSDPKYAEAFEQARIEAGQSLEDDAIAWARKGIFEPIVYQGSFCFAQRERVKCTLLDGREVFAEELPDDYNPEWIQSKRVILESYGPPLGIYRRSEGLMSRLLKAFLPSRYADRGAVEISGPKGGPIPLEQKRLAALTDDELAQLIAVTGKLAAPGSDDRGTETQSTK
jgi:hypothetical protein